MADKIKVVIKEVDKAPYVAEIENTLEAQQEIVGGYIECIDFNDEVVMVCDEEGKLKNKPINFMREYYGVNYDYIVGTVFFVGIDEDGDFASLNKSNIDEILEQFE